MADQHDMLSLTLRNLYLFLRGKLYGFVALPVFSAEAQRGMTLNVFWHGFLQHFVDEDILRVFFQPSVRLRSVSTMMNRSDSRSCPRALFEALESDLTPEKVVNAATWIEKQFSKALNPSLLLESLTSFEQALNDLEFEQCLPFFSGLRIQTDNNTDFFDFNIFLCAVRITWLGLHAIYGDEMSHNSALRSLRASMDAAPSRLWQRAHTAYTGKPEKWRAPTEAIIPETGMAELSDGEDQEPACSLSAVTPLLQEIRQTVMRQPLPRGQEHQAHDGWYVVANWTDPHIALNDMPKPTYNGATALSAIPNGTVLYVINISDYNGLHNSSGIWGYTGYRGYEGYVPMNLLVRIHLP